MSSELLLAVYLTHFRPMFHFYRFQVVGFYKQNVWKHPWKSDILSKDAGHEPTSLHKLSLFRRCFSNILLVKTNYLVST